MSDRKATPRGTVSQTWMVGTDELDRLRAMAVEVYGNQRFVGKAARRVLRRALGLAPEQLELPHVVAWRGVCPPIATRSPVAVALAYGTQRILAQWSEEP